MPPSEPPHRVAKLKTLKQCDKATRDRIRWICEWEASKGSNGYHNRVFEAHNVSRATGYRILREDPNPGPKVENRGRPAKTSDDSIDAIEAFVEEHGWTSKTMSWDDLAREACNSEVSGPTLRRAMGTFDYHRCPRCNRGWLNDELAKSRHDFAEAMLHQRPHPQDWHQIVFSGEASWSFGGDGRPRIIDRPGERLCKMCRDHKEMIPGHEQKRTHEWLAVGLPLSRAKSDVVFYNSGNVNGKMTAPCYIDNVLEPVVKPWLGTTNFVLCEDTDASWTLGVNSPATRWRKEHRLPYYYNPRASPDLTPIHDCFRWMEHRIKTEISTDSGTSKAPLYFAWQALDAETVAAAVDATPFRLHACIQAGGQYVHNGV